MHTSTVQTKSICIIYASQSSQSQKYRFLSMIAPELLCSFDIRINICTLLFVIRVKNDQVKNIKQSTTCYLQYKSKYLRTAKNRALIYSIMDCDIIIKKSTILINTKSLPKMRSKWICACLCQSSIPNTHLVQCLDVHGKTETSVCT